MHGLEIGKDGIQRGRLDQKSGEGQDWAGTDRSGNGVAGRRDWVTDERGLPRVFYHWTADDISAFDLSHPNRKDSQGQEGSVREPKQTPAIWSGD